MGPFRSLPLSGLGFPGLSARGNDRAYITGRVGLACGKVLANITHGCEEKALKAGVLGMCGPVTEPKHPGGA